MSNPFFGEVDTVQSKLIWEIKDFERLAQDRMLSPYFDAISDNKEKNWLLYLFMNVPNSDLEEWIGICLCQVSKGDGRKVTIEFAILNVNNEEVCKFKSEEQNDKISVDDLKGSMYFTKYFVKKDILLKDQKQSLLNEGTLKIICTITTNKYTQAEKHEHDNEIEGSLRLEESKHLLNLLLSGTCSDVVFSVEGRKISAHKSIIVNRSPVFDAMFKHDMIESKNNVIVVEDISYSAIHDLLKFIYSGTVPVYIEAEQYESYKNLMIAANKYSISNLKAECERRLSNILKVDNVFECLNLAETHNASKLKENAIDFIACNGHEIIASPVYREFGNLHPEIASEVFRAVVEKMNKVNK